MLLVTNYAIASDRELPTLSLPLELALDEHLMASIALKDDILRLRLRRRVNPAHLAPVSASGLQSESHRQVLQAVRIVLDPDQKPESVLAANIVSALAFLSGVPLSLVHHAQDDRFVAEDDDDSATLDSLGTDLPFVQRSFKIEAQIPVGAVSAESITALTKRPVGVRLYADALKSSFAPAQFRDLWRVLESAFNRTDAELVRLLSRFAPCAQLGFDRDELTQLLVLRGRASHAATRQAVSLEEVASIQRECSAALTRLTQLAQRVILTKKSWGYPTSAVDELLPLVGYVKREGGVVIFTRSTETANDSC